MYMQHACIIHTDATNDSVYVPGATDANVMALGMPAVMLLDAARVVGPTRV